jgi:hypothetical protein
MLVSCSRVPVNNLLVSDIAHFYRRSCSSMNDAFQTLIDKDRARLTVLRETFERERHWYAISQRDSSYAILLTRNGSSDASWRVTSFRDGEPVGHREYDLLEGGPPIQRAFQEFASADFRLTLRTRRRSPSPTPSQPA